MNQTKDTKPQLARPHESRLNSILVVDETSGLPDNYESFFAAYRPLMLASAARANIPPQDREDAVHEVQIKFWQKNGLTMFNPEYGTKFATLLRKWAGLFMLQEMDKVKKSYRSIPAGIDARTMDGVEPDVALDVQSDRFIQEWAQEAQDALERSGNGYLVPVLDLCVRAAETGTAPSRAEIAEAADVSIVKATPLLKELRKQLTNLGLGIESLYDA